MLYSVKANLNLLIISFALAASTQSWSRKRGRLVGYTAYTLPHSLYQFTAQRTAQMSVEGFAL
jgi:hypothetical protein